MRLRERERLTLSVLALLGLAGAALVCWQGRPRAWRVDGPPPVEPAAAASWDRRLDAAGRIDINAADAGQLERLPDIGPSLAGRIVAHRDAHGRFHSVEQLAEVAGIGPRRAEALRPYVLVE
jgi:competence protein ComEA